VTADVVEAVIRGYGSCDEFGLSHNVCV